MRYMIFSLAFAMTALTTFSGCESKERVALAKAEQCINKSNASTVSGCMSLLEGYDSEKASALRCAALYIQNGFTGDRLSDAFQRLKTNTAGTDPMITAMSFMAFTSTAAAEQASVHCLRSNVLSMQRLVTMTLMANQTADLAASIGLPVTTGPNGIDETQLATAITNLNAELQDGLGDGVPSAASLTALGATIPTAAEQYCSSGSSYSNTTVCTNLNNSIGNGTTPDEIVAELILQLTQN